MHKIGIDVVNNQRIERLTTPSFIKRVLSSEEIEEYNKRVNKNEYLAGRFAAKEAILKCYPKDKLPVINQITIKTGTEGEPVVHYRDSDIQVSISHDSEVTVAVALLNVSD